MRIPNTQGVTKYSTVVVHTTVCTMLGGNICERRRIPASSSAVRTAADSTRASTSSMCCFRVTDCGKPWYYRESTVSGEGNCVKGVQEVVVGISCCASPRWGEAAHILPFRDNIFVFLHNISSVKENGRPTSTREPSEAPLKA